MISQFMNINHTQTSVVVSYHALYQEIHEQLYWRIVTHKMPVPTVVLVLRRVYSRLQIPFLSLTIILPSLVKVRTRNSIVHYFLRILHRCSEQLCQVFVLRILVQFLLPPTLHAFTVPYQHVKETVQKQYHFILKFLQVQFNRCRRRLLHCVLEKRRLNHRNAV